MAAELFIYDDIGPAWLGMVNAKDVIDQLKGFDGQRVTVRINSPGGDVNEGIAIYNALRAHKAGCEVIVDGFALSIASAIACAARMCSVAWVARNSWCSARTSTVNTRTCSLWSCGRGCAVRRLMWSAS